jgi:hypothetical protein
MIGFPYKGKIIFSIAGGGGGGGGGNIYIHHVKNFGFQTMQYRRIE